MKEGDVRGQPAAASVDRGVVLFVTTLASFVGSLMSASLNIALPTIGKEYAVDAITLSWVATAFLLAFSVALVPIGRLADIHGRRRVFLYGSVAWTITSLLCGLAPSAPLLIAFRALQGVAGAAFTATATALVTSVYPPRERGRALGIAVAGVYIGLAVGPSLGGVMTQHLGWRSMLFLNAALGAVAFFLIVTRLRAEWVGAKGERMDPVGSVIFGVCLISVMYGFSTLPAALGLALILFGVICLAAFVVWETRVPDPVVDINLFRRNTVFAFSNLAALINYAATFALTFLLSLYLQYVRGLDPQTAGLIILAEPIVMAVFSPLAGRLSDRVEPRIVASCGMALTAVGLGLLAMVDDSSSLAYIVVALVVAGFGFALFSSPNTNAIMSAVERSYLGIASASVGVMRAVGQMLSMGIATLILAVYVGGVQITPQNHDAFASGFRLAFTIFALLCAVGVFSSLSRGRMHA